MKKIFMSLIFILFLIPTVVLAEEKVEIKSITLLEKSENTEINKEASTDGEKINIDLTFYDKDDYATYKVVVFNPNDVDLFFNEKSLKPNNDTIGYALSYADNSNIISSGETKEITIKAYYKTTIDSSLFKSGKYEINNATTLTLSDKLMIENTLKEIGLLTAATIVFVLFFIAIGVIKIHFAKKNFTMMLFLIGLLIPCIASALVKVEIPVDSKIIIKKIKPNNCTYDGELVSGATYVNGQYTYTYLKEMTWNGIRDMARGWRVELTDKNSTEAVTTKLCTYINDKPVTSMAYMFENAKTTSVDFSSFDTSNITNMTYMFKGSSIERLDLKDFDTSNVTSMDSMFYILYDTNYIDISSFDTRKAYLNVSYIETFHVDKLDMSSMTIGKASSRVLYANEGLNEIIAPKWIDRYESYLPNNYYYDDEYRNYTCLSSTPHNTVLHQIKNKKVIKYYLNGGELEEKGKVIEQSETTYGSIPTPTREGREFLGWTKTNIYSNSNLSSAQFVNSETSISSSYPPLLYTLYALWSNPDTYLDTGLTINSKFRTSLQSTSNSIDQVKHIKRAEEMTDEDSAKAFEINAPDSVNKVYAWFDGTDTLYIYSSSPKIYLNYNSSDLFKEFHLLEDIDLSMFDFSDVRNMDYMFKDCVNLKKLDFSKHSFSSLMSADYAFATCVKLEYLDISPIDLHNVSNSSIFYNISDLKVFIAPRISSSVSISGTPELNIKYVDEEGNGFYSVTTGMNQGTKYKKAYLITYKETGNNAILDKFVAYDNEETVDLPVPKKDGYKFLGWSTTTSADGIIQDNKLTSVSQNYTLYGIWEAISS